MEYLSKEEWDLYHLLNDKKEEKKSNITFGISSHPEVIIPSSLLTERLKTTLELGISTRMMKDAADAADAAALALSRFDNFTTKPIKSFADGGLIKPNPTA